MPTIGHVPYYSRITPAPTIKAWTVIGRTFEGEAYCPLCVHNWNEIEILSRPIFASDDAAGLTCGQCGKAI
jgi:hypothetical protein